ncbi:hypothetical protein DW1_0668 [Proteiniborus sp. DW1]|nr:hypothetical protein DW1_0668 [Proteiniborus sp. DW1]
MTSFLLELLLFPNLRKHTGFEEYARLELKKHYRF